MFCGGITGKCSAILNTVKEYSFSNDDLIFIDVAGFVSILVWSIGLPGNFLGNFAITTYLNIVFLVYYLCLFIVKYIKILLSDLIYSAIQSELNNIGAQVMVSYCDRFFF